MGEGRGVEGWGLVGRGGVGWGVVGGWGGVGFGKNHLQKTPRLNAQTF